jgi:hypothetical protein
MRRIVRLALLAVVLVGGRQLWIRQGELHAAREDLNDQRQDIEATEADLYRLDRSIDESAARVAALDAKLTSLERLHRGGIPPSIVAEYSAAIAERNEAAEEHNALVSRQRDLRGTYQARVDTHNARVAEINSQVGRGPLCALLPEALRPSACKGDD